MFDNFKNIAALMQNAGSFKEKADELKRELDTKTVEAESGGGAVRVTMTGKGRVQRIDLNQTLLLGIAGDDKTVVEELIASAVNAAHDKVQALLVSEVQKVAGDINLPFDLGDMLGSNTPPT